MHIHTLVFALLPAFGLQAAAASEPPASLTGAWQLCGAERSDADKSNPRGIPNIKFAFHADGRMEAVRADRTPAEEGDGRFGRYIYKAGRLEQQEADGSGATGFAVIGAGNDRSVLRHDSSPNRGLVLCRLGDINAIDQRLQSQSIEYFRTWRRPARVPVFNPAPGRAPAGSLMGTWELVRVSSTRTAPSLFGVAPFGFAAMQISFEPSRICVLAGPFHSNRYARRCHAAAVDGQRVRLIDAEDQPMLAILARGDFARNAMGALMVHAENEDYEFMWLGPDVDDGDDMEGRVVLTEFRENDH